MSNMQPLYVLVGVFYNDGEAILACCSTKMEAIMMAHASVLSGKMYDGYAVYELFPGCKEPSPVEEIDTLTFLKSKKDDSKRQLESEYGPEDTAEDRAKRFALNSREFVRRHAIDKAAGVVAEIRSKD